MEFSRSFEYPRKFMVMIRFFKNLIRSKFFDN
jgi:hypothetical protein